MSFKRAPSQRQSAQRPLERSEKSKGMVLPFRPLNMAFSHMYYSVDLPSVRAPPSAVEPSHVCSPIPTSASLRKPPCIMATYSPRYDLQPLYTKV